MTEQITEETLEDWRKTDSFMQAHRGGSGNVWVARLFHADTGEEGPSGVFSCWEAVEAWRNNGLPEEYDDEAWSAVVAPYVVDEPEFANRAKGECH